jgi:hydroxyacylglutathione hydrolase
MSKGDLLANEIIVKQIPVEPFKVMTYLVACPRTREAVIIDPAGEEDKLLALIRQKGFKVRLDN